VTPRRRRTGLIVFLTVAAILGALLGVARYYFSGPRLANFLVQTLFKNVRGCVTLESVDWPFLGITGRNLEATVTDLRVYAPPSCQELVMHVPKAVAIIDWPQVAFDRRHDVTVQHVKVIGGFALVKQQPAEFPTVKQPSEVGFIAAFQRRPYGPNEVRSAPKPGPIILLKEMVLEDVEVGLEFYNWNAHVKNVSGQGVLRQSFREPGAQNFTFAMAAHVESGDVEFARQHFDVVDVEVNRFGQYPYDRNSLQFAGKARTVEGASVQLHGRLKDVYETDPWRASVELFVDATDGGALLSRLSKGYLAGEVAAGHIEIHGPMPAPKLVAEGRALAIVGKVPATIDHVSGAMDIASTNIEVGEAEVSALGGRAEARGRYNLLANVIPSATVRIVEPMNVSSYLPPALVREAGSHVTGTVQFSAVPPAWTLYDLHLHLGHLNVDGSARLIGDLVATPGLAVNLEPDVYARVAGRVSPRAGKVDLDFRLDAGNLPPHLARLGLPPVGRSLEISSGHVSGTVTEPVISARATLLGAPLTPRVEADVTYRHAERGGRVDVRRLSADPMGGKLTASGGATLGGRPQLDGVTVDAAGIDLSSLPAGIGERLSGRGDVSLRASGPLTAPRGSLDATLAGVTFDGHTIGRARVKARGDTVGLHIDDLHIGDASGKLDVSGLIGWPTARGRRLDLRVVAQQLSLGLVPQKPSSPDERPLELVGFIGANVHLGGTTVAPEAGGTVDLAGVGIYDTALGGGRLHVASRADGRIGIAGRLFQDKIGVDGSLALGGPTVDAAARFTIDQLELEELVHDLADRVGAHGWVSGTIDVATAPSLVAVARLDRVHLDFDNTDADGRPDPIVVQNQGVLELRADAEREELRLLQPLTMASDTGTFTLAGYAGRDKVDARLQGDVQLRLIELFTRRFIAKATGSLAVDLQAGGTLKKPTLDGTIGFNQLAVVPRDQEAEIRVPEGALILSLNQVRAKGVQIEVEGERLVLDGTLGLTALKPTTIDLTIGGRLPAKLLEMFAAEHISHGAGSAAANMTVRGPIEAPAITGSIEFDREMEIAPRALRRELSVRGGRIYGDNQQVIIERVHGALEDGNFTVAGVARLRPRLSIDAKVELDGVGHRIPGILEVELGADVDLRYRTDQLSVSGEIDVVEGRFVRQLQFSRIATNILVPARVMETAEPFWKGSPLLANMDLDLNLVTKGKGTFLVSNEIAELALDGSVRITGTPQRPVFDGQVTSVGEGVLKFPGIKIRQFDVSQGEVTFSPYLRFPDKTPTIDVRAEAPFVDYSGSEHRVFLEIRGTLDAIEWSLRTSTGLNQAQTLSLISTGRTPEELLGRVRGSAASADAVAGNPSQAASSAGSFYDEFVKSFTGDIIDTLVADAIRNVLGLDCFSLSVGGSSVRVSACKKLGQLVTVTGEYEQGLLGFYRYEGNLSVRPTDDLSLVLQGWGLRSAQEIEGTSSELRLQLEYRFTLR